MTTSLIPAASCDTTDVSSNMPSQQDAPLDPTDAIDHLTELLARRERVLLVGASGTGKSTLARAACERLEQGAATYICADPGRPAFGPPGALTRSRLVSGGWEIQQIEGISTMDCARFRAPLLSALARLSMRCEPSEGCVIDAPGITRGLGAIELLAGMLPILGCQHVFVMIREEEEQPGFVRALEATGCDITMVLAAEQAKRPSDNARYRDRMQSWKEHLGDEPKQLTLKREELVCGGALPTESAWKDRIVALRDRRGDTLCMAHIEDATPLKFVLEVPATLDASTIHSLVVRDLGFKSDRIRTLKDREEEPTSNIVSPEDSPNTAYTQRSKPNIRLHLGEGPIKQGGSIRSTIVGNLFEDPMVVLRLDHRQRCLFFDLGEVRQVPTRIVHQCSDIFITHAHLDHFGDFPWLLRRMVGTVEPIRLFGPVGISDRVDQMVHAFTWDRIEDRGPRFEVHELHPDGTLKRCLVQAGIDGRQELSSRVIEDGIILDEPRLRVRAVEVDHGCPVLAYAVEEPNKFDVRGNLLKEKGWKPGPWLGELKTLAARRDFDMVIEVTCVDGGVEKVSVQELADELLIARPGQKIVYATDFAGHEENREKVIALAKDADLLICESSFEEGDREQAERTGHLCAKDCAEIARDAGVNLLVPFHLSVRYEHDPTQVYREILEVFDRVHVPQPIYEELLEGKQAQ